MKYIDDFLNKITMYRLVLNGLFVMSGIAIMMGFAGVLSYGGLSLIVSFFILTVACYSSNRLFARILRVHANAESDSITALILFLICFPAHSLHDAFILVLVGITAMASKYILVWKKKHIFNPAAVAIVIFNIFGSGVGAWWVGSLAMLVPVAIFGFLVLRKVRRFSLFFAFLSAGVASILLFGLHNHFGTLDTLKMVFTSWPIFFFGSIMLTEPSTTPPTRKLQILYGILVGLLFGSQWNIGTVLYSTPAIALVLGNIFSFFVSPRVRLRLSLMRREERTGDIHDFIWKADEKLSFKPGQYLEWTLGHKNPDKRGNRRYFTIASSPTEENIILGTKFYPNPSSFKKALLSLEPGASMVASQLSGEFTLPEDKGRKLAFIAGGIGATPFRSMAKYMIDTKEDRDIVHLYSNKSLADIAYKDIFDAAQHAGWKNIYIVNEPGNDPLSADMRTGFITKEMLMAEIPDYKERMFYISGTRGMVSMFENTLKKLGVAKHDIRTDFFPGFV